MARVLWLLVGIVSCLTACSGDPELVASPEAPDAGPPAPAVAEDCPNHCKFLQSCGAVPTDADCERLCTTVADTPVYSEPCRRCMEGSCEKAGACVLDHASCGAPTVAVTAAVDVPPQTETRVAMMLWDGSPTGAVSSKVATAEGSAVLSLGRMGQPGLAYKLAYFADTDGDGICQAGIDPTGQRTLFIDGPSSLVYSLPEPPAEAGVCSVFTSKQGLCIQRCDELVRCAAGEAGAACVDACLGQPTRSTLDCLGCQRGRSCEEQALACQQPGGACEAGYIPPDVQLLIGANDALFPDAAHVGRTVRGKVRNAAGRLLAEGPPATVSTEGSFFMNFGEVVWQHQTYTVTFYLDANDDGSCGAGEPVYDLDVTVNGDVVLLYKLFTQDMLQPSSCASFDAP